MSHTQRFYRCRCFLTDNFFLKDYKLHVRFESEDQLLRDYGKVLRERGCQLQSQVNEVVKQLSSECERRRKLAQESQERRDIISRNFQRVHTHLYKISDCIFAPGFLDMVKYSRSESADEEGLLKFMNQCTAERVYSFPVFTKTFCEQLVEEMRHFEQTDLPKGRPNTMNQYGVLLDELGFNEELLTPLRTDYLTPVCQLLFPDWGGETLDSHKAFIVKYKMGEDLDLSYHYDNAEITLNVSLGQEFTGGNLYFGGMSYEQLEDTECTEHEHRPTIGVLHRGQHMHGALPISSGERYNLIIWMRSSKIRNMSCPMCHRKPRLEESHGFADGFTNPREVVSLCDVN